MLKLKHLGRLESQDPFLGETLRDIQDAINRHGIIAGIDPTGVFPAPAPPNGLTVTQVAGGFDVSVIDSNPQRGVYYFVEFDPTIAFGNARTVALLTARNQYLPLGQATYFFRCYSQFRGSQRSGYTYFGGVTPQSVTGGAAGTPTLNATQGTGANTSSGNSPNPPVGAGFGPLSTTLPPRNLPGGR